MLHYCVKTPRGDFSFGHMQSLENIIYDSQDMLQEMVTNHSVYRYCYVTFDNSLVMPRSYQRTQGWHIDGMQGAEVEEKKPGDLNLIWCDRLPTEILLGVSFDMDEFDENQHNLFNFLANQSYYKEGQDKEVIPIPTHTLVAMSPYQVHRSQINLKNNAIRRNFIRISWTHVPVTSRKMTFNPFIEYDYLIHTTSGEIPVHLA